LRPNPTKQTWIDLAISIRNYHVSKLKSDIAWRVEDTARELHRSIGAVSQYLLIASFLKTHENQIKRLETMKEAVSFCKDKKRDMLVGE